MAHSRCPPSTSGFIPNLDNDMAPSNNGGWDLVCLYRKKTWLLTTKHLDLGMSSSRGAVEEYASRESSYRCLDKES